jgi:hypothetical protein
VGPNHSGKSETLKEIESWPGVDMTRKILSEVHYSVPSSDSGIDEVFQRFNAKPKKGMILNRDQIFVSYPLFDKVMLVILSKRAFQQIFMAWEVTQTYEY